MVVKHRNSGEEVWVVQIELCTLIVLDLDVIELLSFHRNVVNNRPYFSTCVNIWILATKGDFVQKLNFTCKFHALLI
jgi:hypothetical protein